MNREAGRSTCQMQSSHGDTLDLGGVMTGAEGQYASHRATKQPLQIRCIYSIKTRKYQKDMRQSHYAKGARNSICAQNIYIIDASIIFGDP
jgi:hypothetical protein